MTQMKVVKMTTAEMALKKAVQPVVEYVLKNSNLNRAEAQKIATQEVCSYIVRQYSWEDDRDCETISEVPEFFIDQYSEGSYYPQYLMKHIEDEWSKYTPDHFWIKANSDLDPETVFNEFGRMPTEEEMEDFKVFDRLACNLCLNGARYHVWAAEGRPTEETHLRSLSAYCEELRSKRDKQSWEVRCQEFLMDEHSQLLEWLPSGMNISILDQGDHGIGHASGISKEKFYEACWVFAGKRVPIYEVSGYTLTGRTGHKDFNPFWINDTKLSYSREFNLKYWDGEVSTRSLLKAGVSVESLLRRLGTFEVDLLNLFTRKQIINFILASDKQFGRKDLVKGLIPAGKDFRLGIHEVQSTLVWAWAVAHPKWVAGVRTVHGPGGVVEQLHNHTLVSRMTDDMLPRGVKTSPRVVEEALEEIARQEMEKLLAENQDLPVLKLTQSLPAAVKQLTTSVELKREGTKMNHCVGGYIGSCLDGVSYIFHVEDGTALGATVEISPNPWRVVQAMNYGNSRSTVARDLIEEHVIPFIDSEV